MFFVLSVFKEGRFDVRSLSLLKGMVKIMVFELELRNSI